MYWAILIVCNIPIYLFFGWLIFDTKDQAAESFWDTIVLLLKKIFIPSYIRVFMDDDEDDSSIWTVVIFFAVCAALTYGEHMLISHYFFGETTS